MRGVRLKCNVLAENLLGARSAEFSRVHVGRSKEVHQVGVAVGVGIGHKHGLSAATGRDKGIGKVVFCVFHRLGGPGGEVLGGVTNA